MIALIGTVGVPANYGGFETLAENLVRYHAKESLSEELHVFCSGPAYTSKVKQYFSAHLHYLPLSANGPQSIVYDIWSLFAAALGGANRILLLGVSGALALPLIRWTTRIQIVTNIDGIEWRRDKWNRLAKWFLRLSERLAVRFSHEVVADNAGIAEYVLDTYGRSCHVIAYGGDHAIHVEPKPYVGTLPDKYAFALCRIEPENNIEMILDAFSRQASLALVLVGNWANSEYGARLRHRFGEYNHLYLLDPIYDLGVLRYLRERALLYVHGHSAGGTNPSLVEMMHFGVPVLAYDCVYNRYTTNEAAWYFSDAHELSNLISRWNSDAANDNGAAMRTLARERYTWDKIAAAYFKLLRIY